MQFKFMLMLFFVAMVPGYVGALTFEEEGGAIMSMLSSLNRVDLSKSDWKSTGPTAEDIRAGNEAAAKSSSFFAKRDLGGKLKDAVEKGSIKDIKPLIDAGAELEITDYWGMTPLMTAAQKGYVEIANMLVTAGANIDAFTPEGSRTALVYAIDKGHTEIAKLLIAKAKASCNFKALASAIDKGNTEIVKLLVAKGAAQKNQNEFERLFLSVVQRGDNQMVKALMSGETSIDGFTLKIASMSARSTCSPEVVKAIEDLQKKSSK